MEDERVTKMEPDDVNVEVKKLPELSFEGNSEFNSVASTEITTSKILGKLINDLFAPVLKDYFGCTVDVVYNSNTFQYTIVPKLYFKILRNEEYFNLDEFQYTAFRPMSLNVDRDPTNLAGRVQRLGRISSANGIKIEMTDEGKSILKDFIISQDRTGSLIKLSDDRFDWNQTWNSIPSNTDTFVRVFKLDIFKILKAVYGAKSETGSKYSYQIIPNGFVGGFEYKDAVNWKLLILRLDENNLRTSAEGVGVYVPQEFAPSIPNINTDRT